MKAKLTFASLLLWPSFAVAQTADAPPGDTPAAAAPMAAMPVAPQPQPQPTIVPSDAGPRVSLTISPAHLSLPVVELTGEYRVIPKLGIALVLGGGKITDNVLSATVAEVGASARYYVLGSFRTGLQIGGEVDYVHVSGDNIDVKGAGLAMGAFVGGKWISSFGLTLEGQIGPQLQTASASSSSSSSSESKVGLLLNLNIGYSF
ncbi:MAG TPA: hypothetical protein PLF40_07415 [Kofleriaceae bacterium]|nr:hypothetical protein [Kofleriaceae bacterium]